MGCIFIEIDGVGCPTICRRAICYVEAMEQVKKKHASIVGIVSKFLLLSL